MEEQPADCSYCRVSQVTVRRRHGVWLYASLKPVPHDQVGACAQFFNKLGGVSEIIAVIGIPHDDEPAPSGGDASLQSVAVPFGLNVNHPRPRLFCNFLGPAA